MCVHSLDCGVSLVLSGQQAVLKYERMVLGSRTEECGDGGASESEPLAGGDGLQPEQAQHEEDGWLSLPSVADALNLVEKMSFRWPDEVFFSG